MKLLTDPSAQTDCFWATDTGRCRQMETRRCTGNDCPFMKTREACQEHENKVYLRLASLDEATQERISQKYYNGTRPWARKEGEPGRRRRRRTDKQAER